MTGSTPDLHLLERTMMGLHTALDREFYAHQQALLDRDFGRAAMALGAYRSLLDRHMADEEEHILPRYQALGGDRTDAPTRLFLGEHGKLRAFLDDFVGRLAGLLQGGDDRALLELFDRQATYKNLMLHHDLRERNMLYPFVSVHVPAAEQRTIAAALRWPG